MAFFLVIRQRFFPSKIKIGLVRFLNRVATVRETYLENEIFPWSGKSQGILWMAREI